MKLLRVLARGFIGTAVGLVVGLILAWIMVSPHYVTHYWIAVVVSCVIAGCLIDAIIIRLYLLEWGYSRVRTTMGIIGCIMASIGTLPISGSGAFIFQMLLRSIGLEGVGSAVEILTGILVVGTILLFTFALVGAFLGQLIGLLVEFETPRQQY